MINYKKLFGFVIFAVLIVCASPLSAQQTSTWEESLRRIVINEHKKHINPNDQPEQTRLSWDEFLKLNQLTTKKNEARLILQTQRQNDFLQNLPAAQKKALYADAPRNVQITQAVNYPPLLKNARLIYVGELHYSKRSEQEIQKMVSQYRKAHPQARILWASEFFIQQKPDEYSVQKAKGPASDHFYTTEDKNKTLELARRLDMDILALDEDIFNNEEEGKLYAKINRYWVNIMPSPAEIEQNRAAWDRSESRSEMTPKTETPSGDREVVAELLDTDGNSYEDWIAKIRKQEWIYARLSARKYILDSSAWGAEQRNRLWAAKINAVQKDYDVIFVHTGMGHQFLDVGTDVQDFVNKPFANLYFMPRDIQLPDEVLSQQQDEIIFSPRNEPFTTPLDQGAELNRLYRLQERDQQMDTHPQEFLVETMSDAYQLLYLSPREQKLLLFSYIITMPK